MCVWGGGGQRWGELEVARTLFCDSSRLEDVGSFFV